MEVPQSLRPSERHGTLGRTEQSPVPGCAPGKPEAGKDIRLNPGSGPYAVMPHPTDGSVWYTTGVFGGTFIW